MRNLLYRADRTLPLLNHDGAEDLERPASLPGKPIDSSLLLNRLSLLDLRRLFVRTTLEKMLLLDLHALDVAILLLMLKLHRTFLLSLIHI